MHLHHSRWISAEFSPDVLRPQSHRVVRRWCEIKIGRVQGGNDSCGKLFEGLWRLWCAISTICLGYIGGYVMVMLGLSQTIIRIPGSLLSNQYNGKQGRVLFVAHVLPWFLSRRGWSYVGFAKLHLIGTKLLRIFHQLQWGLDSHWFLMVV